MRSQENKAANNNAIKTLKGTTDAADINKAELPATEDRRDFLKVLTRGLLVSASATSMVSAKMIPEDVRISTGASKDISALAAGQDREAVALGALNEAIQQGTLSSTKIASLLELAKRAEQQQKLSSSTSLPNGFATKVNAHTFTYRVAGPTTTQTQESYIREKLGDDVKTGVLIRGLKTRGVDVSVTVPILSKVTLDTESNGQSRAEQNRHYEGALADPIQATNIAIEAFCAAKKAGLDLTDSSRIKAKALKAGLDEGTATLLEKLTAGCIRVGSVSGSKYGDTIALSIVDGGRGSQLQAMDHSGSPRGHLDPGDYGWAFGARPPPEYHGGGSDY